MKEFILLFRHENVTGKVSPEQMQLWMKQQMDWVGGIAAQNKFVSGTGLVFEEAKVVRHGGITENSRKGNTRLQSTRKTDLKCIDDGTQFIKTALNEI